MATLHITAYKQRTTHIFLHSKSNEFICGELVAGDGETVGEEIVGFTVFSVEAMSDVAIFLSRSAKFCGYAGQQIHNFGSLSLCSYLTREK